MTWGEVLSLEGCVENGNREVDNSTDLGHNTGKQIMQPEPRTQRVKPQRSEVNGTMMCR